MINLVVDYAYISMIQMVGQRSLYLKLLVVCQVIMASVVGHIDTMVWVMFIIYIFCL